jgi:hypothetical protein
MISGGKGASRLQRFEPSVRRPTPRGRRAQHRADLPRPHQGWRHAGGDARPGVLEQRRGQRDRFRHQRHARDIYHRSDRLFEGKIARYADDQRNNRNRNVWGGPGKNGIEVPICNPPSLASPADKGGRGMTSIESVIGACSGLIYGLATNQQLVTTNPSGHPILKPEEANPVPGTSIDEVMHPSRRVSVVSGTRVFDRWDIRKSTRLILGKGLAFLLSTGVIFHSPV